MHRFALLLLLFPLWAFSQDPRWESIDSGLAVADFYAWRGLQKADDPITVLKIDPKQYQFRTYCADDKGHERLPADEWAQKYNLLGVINAGMYQEDYKSNVGYMRDYSNINNPRNNKRYKSVAAFNPKRRGLKPFQIFDTDVTPFDTIQKQYNTVVQNLRLIKAPGENRWERQRKKWSEAALAIDTAGNVLFIYSSKAYSMYDFNEILLSLNIGIVAAQHLEGGPEASLFLSHKGKRIWGYGSYDFGEMDKERRRTFWAVPNVIGFKKRK